MQYDLWSRVQIFVLWPRVRSFCWGLSLWIEIPPFFNLQHREGAVTPCEYFSWWQRYGV